MRSLLAIVTLVVCSEAWAQVTLPHDLQPNTKASASKVMENFRALESAINSGDGGCSVEQVDNSAEITCADGSSAVIAGAGSVLVLPTGVQGEAPDASTIPTGDFYWEDGNGVVLGGYRTPMSDWPDSDGAARYIALMDAAGTQGYLLQDDSNQSVHPIVGTYRTAVHFTALNCEGLMISDIADFIVVSVGGEMVTFSEDLGGSTLAYSSKGIDEYVYATGSFEPISECENEPEGFVYPSPRLAVPYTPPAEWSNAAYPLKLKQHPN